MLTRAGERLAVLETGAAVREAADLMGKPHTDLVVVCDQGGMVGVVTKTDIVGQISRCLGSACEARVDSIMTQNVVYCRANEFLQDVWSVMKERGLQRIPVLDQGRKPIGIIYARDALQYLLTESEDEDELLRDYISCVGYR
jgi:CBS domain-containing protein